MQPDASGRPRSLTLRVRANDLTIAHGLEMTVNDQIMRPTRTTPPLNELPTRIWLYYEGVQGDLFVKGKNVVKAIVENDSEGALTIDQVRLDIRY